MASPDRAGAPPPRAARIAWHVQQGIGRAQALALTLLDAAVPPLLGEEGLRALLKIDYDRLAPYAAEPHNLGGLFPWEIGILEPYLVPGRHIAVLAAGGGREAIGLLRCGLAVDAWECNARLREAGNALLARQGSATRIMAVAPDAFPQIEPGRRYDLCILGWGAYGHIFPASRRIALLRACRAAMAAPLLISWVGHVSAGPRHDRLRRAVRRAIGRLPLVGHRVDDDLVLSGGMVYEMLTPEKVAREAQAAGFSAEVRQASARDVPHALLVPR